MQPKVSFNCFKLENIMKSDIKKKLMMITGKQNEEGNKTRNDEKIIRESTTIFDKVLKKVEEKGKSNFYKSE